MEKTTIIIETTNKWTEKEMLKSIKNNMLSFGGGIGSKKEKASVTIIIKKLKNYGSSNS